jgi:hypothetical protein
MTVSKIRDGLWRWVTPHPDWKPEFDRPDGWGRMVASVYAELDEATVLIDPLVPADPQDRERFWEALDRDVSGRNQTVLILVGSVDHGRSADEVAERYRASGREVQIVGDAALRDGVSCRLGATFEEISLPDGLRTVPMIGMSPGERAFVLDPWRAAVFADAVIGAGNGTVRLAPPSWGVKTPEGRALYDREFRPSVGAVVATRPEILLPSHGDPILTNGASVLRKALESPAWGS